MSLEELTPLQRVKLRADIPLTEVDEARDLQLQLRLEDAQAFFKDYCHRRDIPAAANSLVEQLAAYTWQQRANIQSEKIGDTSVTYALTAETIPLDIRSRLNHYRRARMM
ncbi:phage head-tail connector protein [Paenibacillus sanguinis]|uniref:phage head-tail connector protein n=1 Tax=Paenibacillus sanguinis TaxID=225906 RepID=UPI00037353AA|nr:phage head-tail connector protein [Paenibacillus sanguinis]